MKDKTRLVEIAADVSDGDVVDWARAESSVRSDADRARLRGLRLLSKVSRLHATFHGQPGSTSSLHDSILHPGRTTSAGLEDAETHDTVRWGPLEIIEKVGRGSFGDVYRAWDPVLDREVALKLLRRREAGDDDDPLGSSVIDEGRLQARVRHPGVITVHGADRIDGRVGLWMEFIRGRTLEQELEDRGPFDPSDAARMGTEICRALGAVHDQGLLHRDVKAQNVMRDEKGRLVLGDFGTGRGPVGRDEEDTEDDIAGTPLYLAPEIFQGGSATVQSDLYSLGVLLYHLVTGSYPVRGRSARDLRDAHDLGTRQSLAEARPELPRAFAEVIDRALDSDTGRRYTNAAEMEAGLAACLRPRRHRSKYWYTAGAATAAGAIVIATISFDLWPPTRGESTNGLQAIPFEERDWILITDFENTTGEDILDGATDAAFLERELNNSNYVNVVPRERTEDALRLMKRPVETRLDPVVAREVALRDGQIKAIVTGRAERLASTYLLTASVMSVSGATVASATEEAIEIDEVPIAMRRLANWLRQELGEAHASVTLSNQHLERVTTPSLRALRLYSQGDARYREEQRQGPRPPAANHAVSAQLFREAISEDPEFASAYHMLGWAVRLDDDEAALRHWTRAMELAPNVTERERLFIESTYYRNTGEPERAVERLEALLTLQPDNHFAIGNLIGLNAPLEDGGLDRPEEWRRWHIYRADRRPNDFFSQLVSALELRRAGETDRWKRYARRAYVLKPLTLDEWRGTNQLETFVWLNFFPVYEHWSRGEIDEAYREIERLTGSLATQRPDVRERYLSQAGSYYLAFGQFEKARDLFGRLSDARLRASRLAWLADCRDDEAAIREQLFPYVGRGPGNRPRMVPPLRIVRAGLPLEEFGFRPDGRMTLQLELALGEMALRRGDQTEAVERLDRGLQGLAETYHRLPFYLASESLAVAWLGLGDEERALRVLEAAAQRQVSDRMDILAGACGLLHARANLAGEYRRRGRIDDAEPIEDFVLGMLKHADADHPIVRRITESRTSSRLP